MLILLVLLLRNTRQLLHCSKVTCYKHAYEMCYTSPSETRDL